MFIRLATALIVFSYHVSFTYEPEINRAMKGLCNNSLGSKERQICGELVTVPNV